MKTYRTLTEKDKDEIKLSLLKFISNISKKVSARPEAVANAAFYYLQRNKSWGHNATKKQKKEAYAYWKGICSRCHILVNMSEVKYHHKERGIPDQHNPTNLLPQHKRCHDKEHNVSKGSLS